MKTFKRLVKALTKKADRKKLTMWRLSPSNIETPLIESSRHFNASTFARKRVAFNRMHDWHHEQLHPCFALFLGMEQHIDALTTRLSPFSPLGMVHIANEITQYIPLNNADLQLNCRFSEIRGHEKGVVVVINIETYQSGKHCLTARSTYLYRLDSESCLALQQNNKKPVSPQPRHFKDVATLQFKSDAGRKYAMLSKDYNPIHLYRWSARLFGFKNSIAHGTHTLSRAISALENSDGLPPVPFIVENEFLYPTSLPATICLKRESPADARAPLYFLLEDPNASQRKKIVMTGSIKHRPSIEC